MNTDKLFLDLSVLIVEDEALVGFMLEDYAQELGATDIWNTISEKAALAAIDERRPDIAIIDLNLAGPGTLSFFVADELAGDGVPFIFCTGMSIDTIEPRHRTRPVLGKPFSISDFRIAIETALSKTRIVRS